MEETLRDQTHWMVREEVIKDYLKVCSDAVKDNEVFDTFKSLSAYKKILEHCSFKVANEYYRRVLKNNPYLLDISKIFDNDKIGNPDRFLYRDNKPFCSFSTMQYIGVLSNLIDQFGSLDGFNIVEIGGGYGGQCKVIDSVFNFNTYRIIDLLEPSMLQAKYLAANEVSNWLVNSDADQANSQPISLVISNYALSEVLEPQQTEYVEKILLNSKRGYITCNREIKAIDKIASKFDTFMISTDINSESKENFIITW